MRHVARLLQDKPRDVRGIAVPGMPRGSPGMEMPDGSVDAFAVMAFSSDGKVSEFRACPAGATRGGRYNEIHSRSEEHTSELQSLMRNSYDVFCLKKKKQTKN